MVDDVSASSRDETENGGLVICFETAGASVSRRNPTTQEGERHIVQPILQYKNHGMSQGLGRRGRGGSENWLWKYMWHGGCNNTKNPTNRETSHAKTNCTLSRMRDQGKEVGKGGREGKSVYHLVW